MAVRIVGGMSFPGSITLQSDQFVSKARYQRDGTIETTTYPVPAPARMMHRFSRFPIPRILLFALFIFYSFSRLQRVCIVGLITYDVLFPNVPAPVQSGSTSISHLLGFMFPMLYFGWMIWAVRKWHAAEHKVIAAYTAWGTTSVTEIANANRIDMRCGGRFVLPFMLVPFTTVFLCKWFGWNVVVVSLFLYELLLWVDHLFGFDRIPVTRHASYLLQKYITTKEPDQRELETAQKALTNLLDAHAQA